MRKLEQRLIFPHELNEVIQLDRKNGSSNNKHQDEDTNGRTWSLYTLSCGKPTGINVEISF